MLIAIWMVLTNMLPNVGESILVVIDAVMPIFIILIGISLLVSVVGARINFNFMGPIGMAILRAMGFLGRTLISAIGWCLRHFILFIPQFFSGVRRSCVRGGMSEGRAILLSIIATILLIAVII